MDKKVRLATAFDMELPDRPPILGGWMAAPEHIQSLTNCSEDEYWSDPFYWGLEAERHLGSDGVITIFEPVSRGEYRCVDGQVLEERNAYTLEAVLAEIAALPDPETLEASFDETQAYAKFLADHQAKQTQCGDLLWCPADWGVIPKALWYHEYGYENALTMVGLYPDHVRKLIEYSGTKGRQQSILRARAIHEGLHPRAILTGEDLCSQKGPMVSPDFLRREYFHWVEYALEPLVDVGAKVVWHCDGNYRPLLDDVLACGIGGLQGFQSECGMELEWIVDRRTRDGNPLLIFGPMSVTTTLPYGSPADVRNEVQRAMEISRDRAALVFFTSNTLTPDIPLENIQAFWHAVLDSSW